MYMLSHTAGTQISNHVYVAAVIKSEHFVHTGISLATVKSSRHSELKQTKAALKMKTSVSGDRAFLPESSSGQE